MGKDRVNPLKGFRMLLLAAGVSAVTALSAHSWAREIPGATRNVTPACASETTPVGRRLKHFYLRAATGSHLALWSHYQRDMQLAVPIDSADIRMETDPARCAEAAALYRATLPGRFDDGAAVVRYGALRAIAMGRTPPDPRFIKIGPAIQLITDSSFTTVIDTLWW